MATKTSLLMEVTIEHTVHVAHSNTSVYLLSEQKNYILSII